MSFAVGITLIVDAGFTRLDVARATQMYASIQCVR